jgi:5-formyltetrahydrofolate cyclo-ligase
VLEPAPGARAVRADLVDVFVVPGLLFDRAGRRLGRGGGHFDRLLACARPDALRVGVCPAERLVDELPEDPWDVRMHRVVTEHETLVASEPRRGADGAR